MTRFELPLPAGYRLQDVLAFHRRDAESVAEQVSPERLRKAMLLDGVPLVLDIDWSSDPQRASVRIEADGQLTDAAQAQAREAALSVLGLRLDPAAFTAFVKKDKLFGPLVQRQPGLRVVQSATVFEALTWAVIGQQINLTFAIALRRTFIQQAGRPHSSGLWCYPGAADAAQLDIAQLLDRKFSRAKAETLLRLAQAVASGALSLELSPSNSIEQISAALLALKGIGPWTVNYGLLRGYGHADCSLHGDVAVRSAVQLLRGDDERPDIAQTEAFLKQYSPHRTMAAAHLWASLHPRDAEKA